MSRGLKNKASRLSSISGLNRIFLIIALVVALIPGIVCAPSPAYGVVTGSGTTNLDVSIMTHNVTYHGNGGDGADQTVVANDGDSVSALSPVWVKSDMPFSHWNTQADDSGKDIEPGAVLTVYDDVELYAIYAPTVPVTGLDSNHLTPIALAAAVVAACCALAARRLRVDELPHQYRVFSRRFE